MNPGKAMTITRRNRAQAETVATVILTEGLTPQNLRAVASALGCQDPDAILSHLNPQVMRTRLADVLVEAVIEAMEDSNVA